METNLYLVRHAPVVGQHGRCYGITDVECDTTDAKAFAGLASILPGADALWTVTPLSRTRRTADAVWAARKTQAPEYRLVPGLIEQSFGNWQGKTYAELGAYGQGDSRSTHRHWLTMADIKPEGGESFVEVCARVARAIDETLESAKGGKIAMICHGGVIRAALAHALGLAPEAALAIVVDTLSVTRLDRFEGPGRGHSWRVGYVNRDPRG
ncbi:MAG: histidine phosphatase family protein [Tagaea sp.]